MRKPYFDKNIKRKQRKGFLWIDNVVVDDRRLSAVDKIVYATLARFADNESQECYPSTRTLREFAQITDPTLYKSLNHLRDLGYIEIDKEEGKVNHYQLNETSILDLEVKDIHLLSRDRGPLKEKQRTSKGEEDELYLHNNTNTNKTLPKGSVKSYGNPDINYLTELLKKEFGLPVLDGTAKENRRYCWLALKKFKNKETLEEIIKVGAQNDFWVNKITSFKTLFNHGVKIYKTLEDRKSRGVAVIG